MSLIRAIAKSILPPPITIRLRAAFKRHELERSLLPALCDPARIGVDIGAALGAYTWPLSRLCKRCVAFEPNTAQAGYLRAALGDLVRIENVALSNRDGETDLIIPLEGKEEKAGLATIDPGDWLEGKSVHRQKVTMRTLDSFRLEPTGFIKLDVEGHELAVLEGAADLLRRDKPTLLIELEERFSKGAIARSRMFLEDLGYRGAFLEDRKIKPIEVFDPAVHQAMEFWGRTGSYINNFVFIPISNLASARNDLCRLGLTVDL